MRKAARILALLLCLCLTVSLLAGCSPAQTSAPAAAPEPTAEQTPAPTPEPTPEPVDYLALYQEAAEALTAQEALVAEYRITQEISLPDYAAEEPGAITTLSETTTRSVSLQGLQGDSLLAKVEDVLILGQHPRIEQKLLYADGVEYVELDGSRFCSETDRDSFLDALPPLLLLDAAGCGPVTGEETDKGSALRFEAPEGAEAWALPEEAELLEAEGSALLSADHSLAEQSLLVRYRFGGLEVRTSYALSCSSPEGMDLAVEMPANAKGWETLDDPGAPLAVKRAGVLLADAKAANAEFIFNYYSEAAGISARYYQEESLLDRGDTALYHGNTNISGADYNSSQTYAYSFEESFDKGNLTTSYSDGTEEHSTMSSRELCDLFSYDLLQYFPVPAYLKDAESKDVGAYRLISFAGTDDYGEAVKNELCLDLFPGQPTILDDYASAYLTKSLTGFLAVEKVSGIPTALNLDYAGIHTIEDAPYSLVMQMNVGLKLFTEDACRDIFEGPADGPAPETRPSPVFYEVSDGEGHSMYLFGTIHIGDDRTAYLPQVIYDALEDADALAVEFDDKSFEESIDEDDELRQTLMRAYYYTDGTTIQNHLDSDVYKEALDYIKVIGNYTDSAEAMKPYLWGNGIELFYLSQGRKLSGARGVDARLMRLARESGKEILNVESGEFQITMVTGYSDPVQELMLAETTSTTRQEYLNASYELYEAWCEGDEQALIQRLAAMDEEERAELDEDELAIYDEYHQKMEVERNAAMVEVAKGYLAEGRKVFFAVGLAHLLGEGGLVHALRDAGFTVTLIDTH